MAPRSKKSKEAKRREALHRETPALMSTNASIGFVASSAHQKNLLETPDSQRGARRGRSRCHTVVVVFAADPAYVGRRNVTVTQNDPVTSDQ